MKKILIVLSLLLASTNSYAYLEGFDCGTPGSDGVFECIKCTTGAGGTWCKKRWCTNNFKIVSCHLTAEYCIGCPL